VIRAVSLRSRQALADLEPAWRELWLRLGRGNPFNHPAWVLAWLKHLGSGIRPEAAAVFEGRDLVALAPLGRRRFGPWQRLTPLGSPLADYPEPLLDGQPGAGSAALVSQLLQVRWDWLDLIDLPADSPDLAGLQAALKGNGLKPILVEWAVCPRVSLTGSWEDYWAAKKRKFRYNLKRSQRLLAEEAGPLRLEEIRGAAEVKAGLARAADIHAARWARRYTRTIFSSRAGRAFFDQALAGLAAEGLARLYLLWAGGDLAAFSLSFVGPRTHYYYIPGFDPQFSKYSPGTLLLWELVARSFREGLIRLDLMKGEEDYKSRWNNQVSGTVHLLAARPNDWARSGLRLRLAELDFYRWARREPRVRRLFFSLMDPLAGLKRRLS